MNMSARDTPFDAVPPLTMRRLALRNIAIEQLLIKTP